MENNELLNEDCSINIKAMLRKIIDIKDGNTLSNSNFQIEHLIDKVQLEHCILAECNIDEIFKIEMSKKLLDFIVKKCEIKKEDIQDRGVIKYSTNGFFFNEKEFKSSVEYCIRTMPESTLMKIRNNEITNY